MIKISLFSLFVYISALVLGAVESGPPGQSIKTAGETKSPAERRFTDAQLSQVVNWVRERAPACPAEAMNIAAEHYLDELASRHPEVLDRISTDSSPPRAFESLLLREIAVSASGPQTAALREDLALKRIEAALAMEEVIQAGPRLSPQELLGKIKSTSQVQHRRLLEGRMEDEDLVPLLKRLHSSGQAGSPVKPLQPKTLSATDLVSEYVRRNQTGSALQRLRAYTIDATLQTATGEKQHLILSRLLPDRFRLVVRAAETTQLILASNGREFWQQSPNRKPIEVTRTTMGTKAYLGEFVNPLFSEQGYAFEKLEDADFDGVKVHRLRVRRSDGSDYVSCIDTNKFREIGRENPGGFRASYSDFREVAGITFAFRETVKDGAGRTAVFEIQRILPNPGLVQSYFEPSDLAEPNYFAVEQWMAQPLGAAALAR